MGCGCPSPRWVDHSDFAQGLPAPRPPATIPWAGVNKVLMVFVLSVDKDRSPGTLLPGLKEKLTRHETTLMGAEMIISGNPL